MEAASAKGGVDRFEWRARREERSAPRHLQWKWNAPRVDRVCAKVPYATSHSRQKPTARDSRSRPLGSRSSRLLFRDNRRPLSDLNRRDCRRARRQPGRRRTPIKWTSAATASTACGASRAPKRECSAKATRSSPTVASRQAFRQETRPPRQWWANRVRAPTRPRSLLTLAATACSPRVHGTARCPPRPNACADPHCAHPTRSEASPAVSAVPPEAPSRAHCRPVGPRAAAPPASIACARRTKWGTSSTCRWWARRAWGRAVSRASSCPLNALPSTIRVRPTH